MKGFDTASSAAQQTRYEARWIKISCPIFNRIDKMYVLRLHPLIIGLDERLLNSDLLSYYSKTFEKCRFAKVSLSNSRYWMWMGGNLLIISKGESSMGWILILKGIID